MCTKRLLLLLAAAAMLAVGRPAPSQAQDSGVYPPMLLQVPFLVQYPPGDAAGTKNCGQTCSVMLDCYFTGKTPNKNMITDANSFLYSRFNDSRYLAANGYYTNVTGRNELGTLLTEKYGLKYRVATGTYVTEILKEVYYGKPVIASVRISGGQLVPSGGVQHWALVVGWNQRDRKVIVNDPGTIQGRFRQYPEADFTATWKAAGKTMIPVSK